MPVIMDMKATIPEESSNQAIHSAEEESNNNNGTTRIKSEPVYDVLGGNDQELARRQYLDDDGDDFDSDDRMNDDLDERRELATKMNSTTCRRVDSSGRNLVSKINGAGDGRRDRDGDEEDDENKNENQNDTTNGGSNGRLIQSNISNKNNNTDDDDEDDDEDFLDNDESTNGYQKDYNIYSSSKNGNSKNDFDNEQRQRQQQQQQHHSEEPEQMRKLFIGGLDYKTPEATLKQHFERFGDVIDCVVMREPQSKRSRGFGFVIYANSSMVDKAQDARPHEIDGREVQSKRAISREDSGKPEAQATVKKVYLGGLSDDIEESELREYFKDFGNIVNINIVAHKDTGKRRGFAFVEYDDYDPVDKIVLKKFHSIRDKRIEAKKAIPKVEMDARKRGDPRAAMAGAMIALSGLPVDGRGGRPRPSRSGGACLWDTPYNAGNYPAGYSNQVNYGYPPHYHSPSAHYGAGNWMMHDSQGASPYGFRGPHDNGGYGRNSYTNQAANWTTDYGGFPTPQGGGSVGPMRLSYQHRSSGPYSSGYGAHRGRGYNP